MLVEVYMFILIFIVYRFLFIGLGCSEKVNASRLSAVV